MSAKRNKNIPYIAAYKPLYVHICMYVYADRWIKEDEQITDVLRHGTSDATTGVIMFYPQATSRKWRKSLQCIHYRGQLNGETEGTANMKGVDFKTYRGTSTITETSLGWLDIDWKFCETSPIPPIPLQRIPLIHPTSI